MLSIKKIAKIIIFALTMLLIICIYQSISYQNTKQLVKEYFDEDYYLKNYGDKVKQSKLNALDHYLKFGGVTNNPNNWFNTYLIKNHIWPTKNNPFIDFLNQKKQSLPLTTENIDIYSKPNELVRSWYAIESLLRNNQFQVTLHLSSNLDDSQLLMFKPQIKRGLIVKTDNFNNTSFYKSSFLKNPERYCDYNLSNIEEFDPQLAVNHVKKDNKSYLMHRLYKYTHWKTKGIIKPCMINFAHYADEPIAHAGFANNLEEFKSYISKNAIGFDLIFINTKMELDNVRIIPGYMHLFVDLNEVNSNKKNGVSFLLSLGGKSINSFKHKDTFNYKDRLYVWNNEKNINQNSKFYISFRDKEKYPKEMQHKTMPSFSKKWLYETEFNIVMENTNQDDYFTEKLLDSIMSLTVPIYYGAPNIGEYFDSRGMLIAKNKEDIIKLSNNISTLTYKNILPYLLENQKKAIEYLSLEDKFINDFYQK